MNCGDFRYLVQKRFDVELSPQDDRALLIHLETCDSCQKFYHQVQQVIIAAEELELSEDLLPQRPDALLSKVLETLPKEKVGLKDIVLSFLGRFGLGRKSAEESEIPKDGGLLPPRISQVSNRLRQVSSEADDFGSGQGPTAPQSQSVLNWGQPISSSAKNVQHETPQEAYPMNTAAQSDQVITRSLGEKFGMSGANSQLNNTQGLSLAESIKQKISEMSKSNIEYQSTSLGSEQMGEPMDEWTIPHSPQWPKLNTDAGPEQWPNEIPGTRAPNAWGSPVSNWAQPNQPETINSVAHFMPHNPAPSEQYVSSQPDAGIFEQSHNQFQQVSEQFQQVPEQFQQLPEQFQQVPEQFQQLPEQFQQVPEQFQQLPEQFQQVPEQFQQVSEQFQQLPEQFQQVPEQFQQSSAQFNQEPASSQQQMPDVAQVKANAWTSQPELMETGNWQSVQFDTTLGARGYSDSPPVSPFPSINNPFPLPPAQQQTAPTYSPTSAEQPSSPQDTPSDKQQFVQAPSTFPTTSMFESSTQTDSSQASSAAAPKQENKQELDFPVENFPQLFAADSLSPPTTLSAHTPQSASTSISTPITYDTTHPAPSSSLPLDTVSQPFPADHNKGAGFNNAQTSSTGAPRIYSVMSKRAQMSADAPAPDAGYNVNAPVQQSAISKEPPVNPINIPVLMPEPVKPSAVVSNTHLSALAQPLAGSAEPMPSVKSEAADDPSRLFNFDDGAIDKLFSNNLGVHERVIPAQAPVPQNFPAANGQPASSPPAAAINLNAGNAAPNFAAVQNPVPNHNASGIFPAPNGSGNSDPQSPSNFNQVLSASIQSAAASISGPAISPLPSSQPNSNAPNAISSPSPYPSFPSSSPPPKLPPSPPTSDSSGLMAVDDSLIDRIFTETLGVPAHISKNVVGKPINERSLPEVVQPANQTAPAMPLNVQSLVERELSPQPVPNVSTPLASPIPSTFASPPPSPAQSPDLVSDLPKNVNQTFGQNSPSSYASGKQKIAGVGKLDSRNEAAGDPGSGRIASIGKFLLDNKDLEKIGKITALDLSDSKMRTLTIEAHAELKNLLSQIDAQEGVTGTVIVGHDGLLIANTVPLDMDPESLGVWALGVFMGTAHVVEKLGDDNVRQIVSQTNQGYLIIANFGAGLLVTLTNPIMLDKLLPLMRTITQLVAA